MGLGNALALPDVSLIAPEAPQLSWWPTSFLAPSAQMEPYVQAGFDQIDTAVATLQDSGLPRDRIGLLGFSQGGCLTSEYLARKGAGLGFGFILSGGLVGTADQGESDAALYGFADKAVEYLTEISGVQVYMSCHEQDPHIPHKRFSDTATVLQRLGATVEHRTKPGAGHGIDEGDVAAVRKLLNR